ncbi:monoheme cytochrome C [Winogradskyella sp. DF17]|uniref:Monoheme cytochrome C n=1 Tax=Winogradskyella pelagia TaxID=2819984 RepID=A0ABS3T398_9FLAO|nr:monoheme cytochrome C [Winogradskyella sp. DF17]MBO3117216.1 monoheme cytochrome C [Winogradskyella sp. DF17]
MKKDNTFSAQIKTIYKMLMALFSLFVVAGGGLVYYANNPTAFNFNSENKTVSTVPLEVDEDLIVDGIHIRTGLVDDQGLMVVVNNCTNCHSAKLVTQNRMNAERWNSTIKWMQETQNLWDLGKNQEIIVNYLVKNYPPKAKGRRMALSGIEWYELED